MLGCGHVVALPFPPEVKLSLVCWVLKGLMGYLGSLDIYMYYMGFGLLRVGSKSMGLGFGLSLQYFSLGEASQKSHHPRAGASCEGEGIGGIPGAAAGRLTPKPNAVLSPNPCHESESMRWIPYPTSQKLRA